MHLSNSFLFLLCLFLLLFDVLGWSLSSSLGLRFTVSFALVFSVLLLHKGLPFRYVFLNLSLAGVVQDLYSGSSPFGMHLVIYVVSFLVSVMVLKFAGDIGGRLWFYIGLFVSSFLNCSLLALAFFFAGQRGLLSSYMSGSLKAVIASLLIGFLVSRLWDRMHLLKRIQPKKYTL